MPSEQDLAEFLRSTFDSLWTLETLLVLAEEPTRRWSISELVAATRSSEMVVARSVEELGVSGLILPEAEGSVRYQPASGDLEDLVAALKLLYSRSPATVRRSIVRARHSSLAAFSDAFTFRKEDE